MSYAIQGKLIGSTREFHVEFTRHPTNLPIEYMTFSLRILFTIVIPIFFFNTQLKKTVILAINNRLLRRQCLLQRLIFKPTPLFKPTYIYVLKTVNIVLADFVYRKCPYGF